MTGRLTLLTLFLAASTTGAEKADMTPENLRKVATHVVVGKVAAIYDRNRSEGGWFYTDYLAEVAVKEREKGEGIEAGGLVYVRYWTREWRGWGEQPESTIGHRRLPAQGDTLRIYLARNAYDGFTEDNKDGGFNVIGANGFEKLG